MFKVIPLTMATELPNLTSQLRQLYIDSGVKALIYDCHMHLWHTWYRSLEEAQEQVEQYNDNRARQIMTKGTKAEGL